MTERWQQLNQRLLQLEQANLTIDLERRSQYTATQGWRIDRHEAELPPEPRGAPLERGAFSVAQTMMRLYKFPPPDLITGIFRPDDQLERRVMLLEGRFLWFRFLFGVRVTAIMSTQTPTEYIWGYRYATLEGHFERGEIEFRVVKNAQTGAVKFCIESFSRTGTIKNILYRLGFWLFGRSLQLRFAKGSLRRMQRLVQEELANAPKLEAAQSVPVTPAPKDSKAAEKLEELKQKV